MAEAKQKNEEGNVITGGGPTSTTCTSPHIPPTSAGSSCDLTTGCNNLINGERNREELRFFVKSFVCRNSINTIVLGCSVLSVSLSFFKPHKLVEHRHVLRPLLNVSWGYLFGSGIWVLHIDGMILRKAYQKCITDEVTVKKMSVYFKITNVAAAILLCSTVALAPRNKVLIYGATSCLLCAMINNFYLTAEEQPNCYEKLQEKSEVKLIIPETKQYLLDCENKKVRREVAYMRVAGLLCSIVGFAGLLPYIFV